MKVPLIILIFLHIVVNLFILVFFISYVNIILILHFIYEEFDFVVRAISYIVINLVFLFCFLCGNGMGSLWYALNVILDVLFRLLTNNTLINALGLYYCVKNLSN
jgi:hypothetical protein